MSRVISILPGCFPGGECPDNIGREAGIGRSAGVLIIEFPPLMWGKSPSGGSCVPPCRAAPAIRLLLLLLLLLLLNLLFLNNIYC